MLDTGAILNQIRDVSLGEKFNGMIASLHVSLSLGRNT
jgi:hypothetical protein